MYPCSRTHSQHELRACTKCRKNPWICHSEISIRRGGERWCGLQLTCVVNGGEPRNFDGVNLFNTYKSNAGCTDGWNSQFRKEKCSRLPKPNYEFSHYLSLSLLLRFGWIFGHVWNVVEVLQAHYKSIWGKCTHCAKISFSGNELCIICFDEA